MERQSGMHGKLVALRRLLRIAMASAGLGRLVCLAAALALADFGLDRVLWLPHELRLALLLVGAGVLLWQLGSRVARPLVRPLPVDALALELETRLPAPADLFASAVQFAAGRIGGAASAALALAAIQEAQSHAALIRPAALVRWRPAKVWAAAGLAAAGACAAAALLQPGTARLWCRRNVLLAHEDWPRRTRLTLVEGPAFVARGESAGVTVKAEGVVPRTARLLARGLASGLSRTVAMERGPQEAFVGNLGPLEETTAFTVRAGDAALPEQRIEVVDRPAVARAKMVIRPPAYISDAPVELTWNAPVFEAPKGAQAAVSLEATKPLSSAVCRVAGGAAQSVEVAGGRRVAFDFAVDADVRCGVVLRDTLGFESAEPFPIEIRAVPDRAPSLSLTASGIGDMLVPGAQVPLAVRATDDYGVVSAWLEETYEGAEGRADQARAQLWQGGAQTDVAREDVVDLQGRGLPAAGRLVIVAAAQDNCAVGGPNTGRSGAVSFRLVSVRELLAALLLRQQDLRRDLEQHIEREKDTRRRFSEAIGSGEAVGSMGAGAADLGSRQRSLAVALGLLGAQYRDVLDQMLNNRVISDVTHQSRLAGIVQPLEGLAAADGAVLAAADAIHRVAVGQAVPSVAQSLMDSALSEMELVRARMLLMEGYASLVSSVQEIAGRQRDVLSRTQELGGSAQAGGSE